MKPKMVPEKLVTRYFVVKRWLITTACIVLVGAALVAWTVPAYTDVALACEFTRPPPATA